MSELPTTKSAAETRVIFGMFDTEGYRETVVRSDEICELNGRPYIWWEARAFEVESKNISSSDPIVKLLEPSNVGHRYFPTMTDETYGIRLADALEQCPAMGDLPPILLKDLFCEPQRNIEGMVNHPDREIRQVWRAHAMLLCRFVDTHMLTAQDFYPPGMPCPVDGICLIRPVRADVDKRFEITWQECVARRAEYFDLEGQRDGERVLLGRFSTERQAELALARMESICALHRMSIGTKPSC